MFTIFYRWGKRNYSFLKIAMKNLFLFLATLGMVVFLSLIIPEIYFFIDHGFRYKEKSYLWLYRSMYDNPGLFYNEQFKVFPEAYKPLRYVAVPGEFSVSEVQNKEISGDSYNQNYDMVISFWAKCVNPKEIKLYLLSDGLTINSFLTDNSINEDGYYFFLATSSFNGRTKIYIQNAQDITSCKNLKIFFKIHPFRNTVQLLQSQKNIRLPHFLGDVFSYYNYEKPNGYYRILILGGSTSAPYGIPIYSTYSFFLQKYFDALWPSKIDVINLALPGGQTNDFLRNFNFYASLRPDMVIIAPVWNDIHSIATEKFLLNRQFFAKITYGDILRYIRKSNFFAASALGYYLYRAFNSILTKKEAVLSSELTNLGPNRLDSDLGSVKTLDYRDWNVYEKRLTTLVRLFNEKKIKVIFFTLPSLSTGTEPDFQEKKILNAAFKQVDTPEHLFKTLKLLDYFEAIDREVIKKAAKKTGAFVVESQDDSLFKNASYFRRKDYFWDHAHLSPQGSELVGRILGDEIYTVIKSDLIQSPFKDRF